MIDRARPSTVVANGQRARRCRLLRDRPGSLAFGLIWLAILPRVWTILFMPDATAYRLFPAGLQAMVLAVYAGQLYAETWGGLRLRMVAAAFCAVAAAASIGVFAGADIRSGNTAFWLGQFGLEAGLAVWLAVRVGRGG